jgi:nucleotidyltransferase substrate binding protein (TIGR01987 family)
MQKIITKFEKLENALFRLEEVCQEDFNNRFIGDATIKRFEFTFELLWKFFKEYFMIEGLTLNSPREILKHAYSSHIIYNEKIWLAMLNDRNLTSHIYDQATADEILLHIKNYIPVFRKTVDYIKAELLPKLKLLTDENL